MEYSAADKVNVDTAIKGAKRYGWAGLKYFDVALRAIPALRQLAAPDNYEVDKSEIDRGEIAVAYEILTEMVPQPTFFSHYDNETYDAGWESDIKQIVNGREREHRFKAKYAYEQHVALAGEAINLTLKSRI